MHWKGEIGWFVILTELSRIVWTVRLFGSQVREKGSWFDFPMSAVHMKASVTKMPLT